MNTSWMGASNSSDHGGRFPGELISRVLEITPDGASLDNDWVLPGASLKLQEVTQDGTDRRYVGVLASRWHRLPVEVETAGWSSEKSELTLRPLADGRRPGWARWYLRTGNAFADLLSAALRTPVDIQPEAEAAAVNPSMVA